MGDIDVSISCITYNHEKYIKEAIESFLIQKTSFKYEILIHDDASTDRTAEIIKEYEEMYPDVIKVIYQKENKYSQNIRRIHDLFNVPRARGKYIALCEGDDFWTDPYKLQKQFDYMEKHSECSLCFHAAKFIDDDGRETGKIAKISNENYNVLFEELIHKATPSFIPTASRFYRKALMEKLPDWYYKCSVGDFPMALILGYKGHFHYINEIMSAYRIGVPGSWTNRTIKGENKIDGNIKVNHDGIYTLKKFNEYTDFKYDSEVKRSIAEREINILKFERNLKEITRGKYKQYFKSMSKNKRIKLILSYYFPKTYTVLASIRSSLDKLWCKA